MADQSTEHAIRHTKDAYDATPYESHPFAQSSPSRLSALGRLFGLATVPAAKARILEVGCASGGNLLPIALRHPESQCLGIDLSEAQVEQGRRFAARLGLKNFELKVMDIMALDASLGEFDYIICHGVFSWIPEPVQSHLLQSIRQLLSPNGVAYISYNAYPGWHFQEVSRHLMLRNSVLIDEPEARIKKAMEDLTVLASCAIDTPAAPMRSLLQARLDFLQSQPSYYVLHEYLEPINHPYYFRDFVAQANRHGLNYLADSEFHTMFADLQPAVAQERLHALAGNRFELEEYLDFLTARAFRCSLLVRSDAQYDLSLLPQRLLGLYAAGAYQPSRGGDGILSVVRGDNPAQGLKLADPLLEAAALLLHQAAPQAIEAAALLEQAYVATGRDLSRLDNDTLQGDIARLADFLLRLLKLRCLELSDSPYSLVVHAGERPKVDELVLAQLAAGKPLVTTRRHTVQALSAGERTLLAQFTGHRDRRALRSCIAQLVASGEIPVDGSNRPREALANDVGVLDQVLDTMLERFGKWALLVA